jgi:hypothetical protein
MSHVKKRRFELNKHNINKVTWFLATTSVIAGAIGYLQMGLGPVEILYRIYALFGGNGAADIGGDSVALAVAAITAPLAVTFVIGLFFFQRLRNELILTLKPKNHILIVGLGHMGTRLARDILENHPEKRLLVIERDPAAPHSSAEDILLQGAIVIRGNGSDSNKLRKACAHRAKAVFILTGSDLSNLEIAKTLCSIEEKNPELTCYLHLANRENNQLLETAVFGGLHIKPFSLYDQAAQLLFLKHPLGNNVDTITNPEATVRVAIVGFDTLGKSVLYRALNLGHFFNQKPIQVFIFDENITAHKSHFSLHWLVSLEKEGYWNVRFCEMNTLADQWETFSQVIFASADAEANFRNAMFLADRCRRSLSENRVQAYVFSDTYTAVGNLLEKNEEAFKNIHAFGFFNELCSYNLITAEVLDTAAKRANYFYNQLHEYNKEGKSTDQQWRGLSAFLQDSNRMQVEHLMIKLPVINHYLEKKEIQFTDEEQQLALAKQRWFKHNTPIVWEKNEQIKDANQLFKYLPLDVLDRLARIEHTRWNAFHILNGWQPLTVEAGGTLPKKDKKTKRHPCLVSWEDLEQVSESHKHDYKSDDLETIMRSSEILKDLDSLWHCIGVSPPPSIALPDERSGAGQPTRSA